MREWIWREFKILLPDDWEMLQFSREPEAGNCAFADRYQFRFEYNWKKVPGPPDYERMLADYIQKLSAEQELAEVKQLRHAGWHGFQGKLASGWTSRLGRYFDGLSRLLELVFLWPDKVDRRLLKQVLGSVTVQDVGNSHFQRWRAFGMELLAGAGLKLETCKVQPALAQLTFTDGKRTHCLEHFERLGMVEHWLSGSVREWLTGKQPGELLEPRNSSNTINAHKIEQVTGKLPPWKFPRLGRKQNSYEAAAWLCPADGRLYSVSRILPPDQKQSLKLAGETLRCCPALQPA